MTGQLIACHECDLLQREIAARARAKACCARCGAVLYRDHPHSLEHALAFALGAAVLYVLANVFPVVGLEVQGELVQTTLTGAARALYKDDMKTLAAVVFVTTVVAPLVQLVAMLGLLVPLRLGRKPRGGPSLFRTLRLVQPWGMVEVLMLGVLVALVKLAHLAAVIPGIALWSLFGLVILLAACVATFDARTLWSKVAY
jgi:paraquat-inducible protein A